MPAPERFDTARLTAERLRADHLADMCALHRDARVMATLGGLRTDAETEVMLGRWLDHWTEHGFGFWMFHDRTDERYVGRADLRRLHVGGHDEVELGYALRAAYWGRGFATEMGRALLAIAFDNLQLAELVCFTLPTNTGSRRVMEKCGFRFERDITYADLPHVLHRLTREQWREAQGELEETTDARR